ncbi:hypothetical protein C7N43_25275 [Sphingobacteriales bacterium UPWRP_1]|nr:hypothetical protein BVG80_17390 [Sphingobacteriales bacterium TSM_CSM]PSJ74208.1 hypothetical protein C7N43_25275 [Sphingobacteriales bacterium UPWRP_1]
MPPKLQIFTNLPGRENTQNTLPYKPFLKVYRNYIVQVNWHLLKLLNFKTGSAAVQIALLEQQANTPPALVVLTDENSPNNIYAASGEQFMFDLELSKAGFYNIVNHVAQLQNTAPFRLPNPFYLTTGKKYEMLVPDADSAFKVYRLNPYFKE